MSLRRNSPLLQIVQTSRSLVGCYHNFAVIEHDQQSDLVIFKNNGWVTKSTSAAQTIVMQDRLGLTNLRVALRNNSHFLMRTDSNKKILELYNGLEISFASLSAYNRGEV